MRALWRTSKGSHMLKAISVDVIQRAGEGGSRDDLAAEQESPREGQGFLHTGDAPATVRRGASVD
eukprot:1274788-Pyramimonas_sp.AAC.1